MTVDTFHLVGRAAAIQSVVSSVTEPGRWGSLVVGETGMGKTALSQAVTAALGEKRGIFPITGTRTLSTQPFGVLAPFLRGMDATAEPSRDVAFRTVAAFFRVQRSESGPSPVVVVDDAHDVDADSRNILARMVVGGSLRLIVLAPRSAVPVEFLDLWTDGFLDRCDLHPLPPDEIHLLCERVLQRKVLLSVSAMLGDLSKGNPMLLQALLQQNRTRGRLFERNGLLLAEDPLGSDLPLLERLRSDLRRRSVDESEVMEAVALAEPLPMDLLIRNGLGPAADNLELLELITVSGVRRQSVRLANPLLAETLRRTVPPARSSELRQKYAESVEGMSNERLIRHVAWALDCGAPLSGEILVRAARAANEEFNFQFSLRATDAAQGSTNRDGMLLEAFIAHTYLGNRLLARDRMEQLLRASTDVQVLLSAVLWICRSCTPGSGSRQPRKMNAVLQETAARIARLGTEGRRCNDVETLTELIALLRQMADRDPASVEGRLRQLAFQMPGIDLRARVVSLALLGNLLNAAGRFADGHNTTLLALKLVRENPAELPMESDYVFFQHLRGLLLGGHWHEAKALLAEHRRSCSLNVMYFGATLQLLEGIVAVLQGQIYAGLEHLRPAVEGLRREPGSELLPLGVGILAYAGALCGEASVVDNCLESFPHETPASNKGLYLLGQAYSLAAAAETGADEEARQGLIEIAGQARSCGLLATERDVLALALQLGDRRPAERLFEVTSTLEGPLSEVLHQYAKAAINNDPASFTQTAAAARGHGFNLLAVSSAEQAAVLLGSRGNRIQSNEVQVMLRQYRTLLDGPVVLTSHESLRAARLTPRERQIVELVQDGQSNRGIARALSLSARTVEGHLYRIFTKLGVNSRSDLLVPDAQPRIGRS